MKPSQNERILSVLSDGQWRTTAEIHRAAGFSRLNSRVSELRSRGHEIQCRPVPHKTGPEGWQYRLLDGGRGHDAAASSLERVGTDGNPRRQPARSSFSAPGSGPPSPGGGSPLSAAPSAADDDLRMGVVPEPSLVPGQLAFGEAA